ncbi:MAG: SEL1-like repeat protein [Ahniella sp.]|nr:SEL1-like repeat protein [Ahniella sp.]
MTHQRTVLAPALFVALCSALTVAAAPTPQPLPGLEAAQLRRAALAGDPVAALKLGESLLDRAHQDDMPEPYRARAIADGEGLLVFAAQAGHVPAMWALAERLQSGRGLVLAPDRAKDWLLRVAQTGDPEAHWRVYGLLREAALDEALGHLRLAAQAGHTQALSAYFEQLEQGSAVPDDADGRQRDLALARQHNLQLSEALTERLTPKPLPPPEVVSTPEPALAELGARMATMQTHIDELLGQTRTLRDELRLRDEQPVDPVAVAAPKPTRKAEVEAAGATEYQRGLDALHADDPVSARKWFTHSAKAGHVGAQNNLGLMLLRGLGGRAEPETGIELLQQAANAGSASAAESLAAAYHYGIGVAANRQRALAWYELAAARGSAPAQVGLQRLAGVQPARDQ